MELKPAIRELESEAAKYINAANALRALEGVAERGRLTFEAVEGGASEPDGEAATGEPATRATRRGRRPKGDKAASNTRTARAATAGTTDRSSRWTPERRAAQAERMRQRRRQREQEASEPDTAAEADPQTADTSS